jgi:hypothetical protein
MSLSIFYDNVIIIYKSFQHKRRWWILRRRIKINNSTHPVINSHNFQLNSSPDVCDKEKMAIEIAFVYLLCSDGKSIKLNFFQT